MLSVFLLKEEYFPNFSCFFFSHLFQTYAIRILREGQNEPQFVFRTFDEFQELHNKLTILFPLWKLPGYMSSPLVPWFVKF